MIRKYVNVAKSPSSVVFNLNVSACLRAVEKMG